MGKTIKDSLYFTFNGIYCRTYKIMQVNLNNGLFEEQLHANRSIIETKIRNNDTPFFHGIEELPLEFDMTITFEDKFSDSDIDDVILWLFQEDYKELIFDNKPDRVYKAMFIGDTSLAHNGLRNGYITLKVRCDSSKVVSPLITSPINTVTTTKTITLDNSGHVDIYPEISIESATGTVVITNKTGGRNEIFQISNLQSIYHLYINCEKEYIDSNNGINTIYLYDDVVGTYPILYKGINTIQIDGQCTVAFRYRLKYKF